MRSMLETRAIHTTWLYNSLHPRDYRVQITWVVTNFGGFKKTTCLGKTTPTALHLRRSFSQAKKHPEGQLPWMCYQVPGLVTRIT